MNYYCVIRIPRRIACRGRFSPSRHLPHPEITRKPEWPLLFLHRIRTASRMRCWPCSGSPPFRKVMGALPAAGHGKGTTGKRWGGFTKRGSLAIRSESPNPSSSRRKGRAGQGSCSARCFAEPHRWRVRRKKGSRLRHRRSGCGRASRQFIGNRFWITFFAAIAPICAASRTLPESRSWVI